MTTTPQSVRITPDEAAFQKWKKAQGIRDTGDDAEFAAWQSKSKFGGKGATRIFGEPEKPAPVAAHLLNAAQTVVPFGGEMLEAGAGALGSKLTDHPMSYAESLNALREETDKIPDIPFQTPNLGGLPQQIPGVKTLERIPGMVYSGARAGANKLLQMVSPAKGGAILGGASGATQADPMSALDRLKSTAKGAATGMVIGKALDVGATAARGKTSRTPGDLAVDVAETNAAADAKDYGPVNAEIAASRGFSPPVSAALSEPAIAKYAARVRQSPLYQNASDAEVLVKAKELLTDVQRRAERGMAAADNDIATGTRLAADEAAALKNQIRTALATDVPGYPAVAPSLGAADKAKALRESAREAGENASDVARRVIKGTPQAARKLGTKSPEAFLRRDVPKMNDDEREAANAAIAARLKEKTSMFHPIRSVEANIRLRPYLNATKGDIQRALDMLVRGLTSTSLNH